MLEDKLRRKNWQKKYHKNGSNNSGNKTKQSLKKIQTDTERDFMNADEAVKYGIIDEVLKERNNDWTNYKLNCSFCGKEQSKVKNLSQDLTSTFVMNMTTYNDILHEETKNEKEEVFKVLNKKKFSYLDDVIVGQDDAKKKLSVAVYNHYKRVFAKTKHEVEVQKSNVMLLDQWFW